MFSFNKPPEPAYLESFTDINKVFEIYIDVVDVRNGEETSILDDLMTDQLKEELKKKVVYYNIYGEDQADIKNLQPLSWFLAQFVSSVRIKYESPKKSETIQPVQGSLNLSYSAVKGAASHLNTPNAFVLGSTLSRQRLHIVAGYETPNYEMRIRVARTTTSIITKSFTEQGLILSNSVSTDRTDNNQILQFGVHNQHWLITEIGYRVVPSLDAIYSGSLKHPSIIGGVNGDVTLSFETSQLALERTFLPSTRYFPFTEEDEEDPGTALQIGLQIPEQSRRCSSLRTESGSTFLELFTVIAAQCNIVTTIQCPNVREPDHRAWLIGNRFVEATGSGQIGIYLDLTATEDSEYFKNTVGSAIDEHGNFQSYQFRSPEDHSYTYAFDIRKFYSGNKNYRAENLFKFGRTAEDFFNDKENMLNLELGDMDVNRTIPGGDIETFKILVYKVLGITLDGPFVEVFTGADRSTDNKLGHYLASAPTGTFVMPSFRVNFSPNNLPDNLNFGRVAGEDVEEIDVDKEENHLEVQDSDVNIPNDILEIYRSKYERLRYVEPIPKSGERTLGNLKIQRRNFDLVTETPLLSWGVEVLNFNYRLNTRVNIQGDGNSRTMSIDGVVGGVTVSYEIDRDAVRQYYGENKDSGDMFSRLLDFAQNDPNSFIIHFYKLAADKLNQSTAIPDPTSGGPVEMTLTMKRPIPSLKIGMLITFASEDYLIDPSTYSIPRFLIGQYVIKSIENEMRDSDDYFTQNIVCSR